MIGNSFLDYVKIRVGITGLRLIAPISCLYLVSCSLKPQLLSWPLVLYSASEVLFYALVYLPRKKRFQQPPSYVPPNLTREQRLRIVRQCIETEFYTATPHSPYPSCWFLPHNHGSRASRNDVRGWLAWALFSIDTDSMTPEIQEEIDGYITLMEEESGVLFGDDYASGKGLRGIRVSLDPVLAIHRPLLWYMIVAVVDTYASARLLLLGFRHYVPSEAGNNFYFPPRPILYFFSHKAPSGILVPYWYRPHRSTTKHPLIFMHGIGIGLHPYIPFLSSVTQGEDKDVGVVIPELLPISMRMSRHTVPPRPDILPTLKHILEYIQSDGSTQSHPSSHTTTGPSDDISRPLLDENKAGWDDLVLVGHSYGTFIAGWMIREYVDYLVASQSNSSLNASSALAKNTRAEFFMDRISHFVLVDPIPILLSNPSVAYNFLYRDPHTVCPKCHNTICNAVGFPPDPNPTTNATLHSSVASPVQSHRPPSLYTQATRASTQSRSASLPSYVNTPRPLPLVPKCNGAWYSSASAWQMWYFASRDIDTARTLFRSFFWAEGGIWRDDLVRLLGSGRTSAIGGVKRGEEGDDEGNGIRRRREMYGSTSLWRPPVDSTRSEVPTEGKHRKVAVVLAGLDQIVPADAVRHHLTQNDDWVDRWVGRLNTQGDVIQVDDWESDVSTDGDDDVRIRVDRAPGVERDRGVGFDIGVEQTDLLVDGGTLEVLYNPHLDHASIFDSAVDSAPLVEVVKRYIRDM